jgi:anti-anti-sigma factor
VELYYHGVARDVLILSADGGLNTETAEQLVAELRTLIDAGARKLIVDCGRLEYISSYGVAVLVRMHKRLREHGGEVKLAAVRGFVGRIINLCGLSHALSVYETVDAAREAFGSAAR